MRVDGYDIDELDRVAEEVLSTLEDAVETDRRLALLAMCRAIVLIADEDELDEACSWIDRLSEEEEEE